MSLSTVDQICVSAVSKLCAVACNYNAVHTCGGGGGGEAFFVSQQNQNGTSKNGTFGGTFGGLVRLFQPLHDAAGKWTWHEVACNYGDVCAGEHDHRALSHSV